jgi:hypothetical protein
VVISRHNSRQDLLSSLLFFLLSEGLSKFFKKTIFEQLEEGMAGPAGPY